MNQLRLQCFCCECKGRRIPKTTKIRHYKTRRVSVPTLASQTLLSRPSSLTTLVSGEHVDFDDVELDREPAGAGVNDTYLNRFLARKEKAEGADILGVFLDRELFYDCGYSVAAFVRAGIEVCIRGKQTLAALGDVVYIPSSHARFQYSFMMICEVRYAYNQKRVCVCARVCQFGFAISALPQPLDISINGTIIRAMIQSDSVQPWKLSVCGNCRGAISRNASPALERLLGSRRNFKDLTKCPKCRAPRRKAVTVLYRSIVDQLLTWFSRPETAKLMGNAWPTIGEDGHIHCFMQSRFVRELKESHPGFTAESRNQILALTHDGVEIFGRSRWPFIVQSLNLHERMNDAEFMAVVAILEGCNGQAPRQFEPVLEVLAEELLDLWKGVEAIDASRDNERFTLRAMMPFVKADLQGMTDCFVYVFFFHSFLFVTNL